ncbi:MAG: DNA polymerase III, subunit gamma and tau [Gammaproteobacteria bacterium RIFCSPHIGHO2_02_FULL_39_13]|nr:MAG: DNA polymerase III, subunit gamma and tau [Gammaproteobacteria bacterium RIFCSPHIGHO2_02_FULL_39_13]OGT49212.1 MAG: DNA polymerase III, subunit gamma and tau [Gammaproteobacteria bacterium RIFCSPHIGHO2_12_FULL_39_24]
MSYLALARKWRPKRFDQVVGQPHVVQALTHALSHNKVHHAYLFTGTHGIGKTTLARIFAKCLNCETSVTATPCEKCGSCQEIDVGCFPDLFEIDAASRTKVEDTRELLDNIPYAPTAGRFKVYLIDEVHMLSGHSFNALLKTLEEPPSHVKFLLATTDPQKLPATVLSRCLQFHLSKMMPDQIEKQLIHILTTEKINFEVDALTFIAESANGSMRDSLSLLDQCVAYGNGQVKKAETQAMLGLSDHADEFELLKSIYKNDAQSALTLTQKWAKNGIHFSRCLSGLLTTLYQISVTQSIGKNVFRSIEVENCAKLISRDDIQLFYRIALNGQRDLPLAPTPQIGFEMIVMRMMTYHSASEKKTGIKSEIKNDDWNTLLQKLTLTGSTLALAQHCAMKSFTPELLQLTLQPKYAALSNARQQQRIQDALTQLSGHSTKVLITIEETQMETPAQQAARSQEANKQSAKKAISADPSIQRIVKTFDATIMEDSIEPTH